MSTSTHKSRGISSKAGSANKKKTSTPTRTQKRSVNEAEKPKLEEFFHDEIKDIYWAEKKLVQTLPKLAKAATKDELRDAFTTHLEQTKEHVTRLEQVFELLGHKPQAKKCDAMEGITEEGASVIEDTEDGTVTRDVALILAGQKAEHYEIATYGGLAEIARSLGHDDVADILETTLEEEKETDSLLTELAENSINNEASQE
ncbi:MAG TPA: ferritin-like domain-containing protein [Puia sp.]|jgi:ferritin-like metal-binding protein YciE|nr:ferritin-like domain-containing protein [Puia sp.]